MVKIGVNDLWTTRPDIAMLLENKELGYIYPKSSKQRVNFICPTCGEVVNRQIQSITRNRFVCPYCSWEKSFGEKIFRRIFINTNINFESEKTFSWSNRKRYDYYLSDYNCIVEIHGAQHFYYTGLSERTLEEEQKNDNWKKDIAIKNGIERENYVVIDARDTSLDSIKSQVKNSKLSEFYNFDLLDWNEVYTQAMNSIMKETCELFNKTNYNAKKLSEELKISVSTVLRYLNIGYQIGLCKKYNWKDVDNDHTKKVICITTNEIFDSIADAENKYNITLINGNCKGRYTYKGELNNKPLIWMFLDDYNKASNEDIKERIKKAYSIYYKSSVVCLNNRKIFYNVNDALDFANIKTSKSIFNCCNGKSNSCGIDKDGNHLIWVRYTDYIDMTEDEIIEQLSNIKFNSFRKVICLNNKKIFNTMKDACSYYNLNMGNLCDSINKEHRNFCGKDFETNEPLKWMYYEDYINEFGEVIKIA